MTLRLGTEVEKWHMGVGDRIMLGHTTIAVASIATGEASATAMASTTIRASAAGRGSRSLTATATIPAVPGTDGTPRSRRASDAEAEALFMHPFSRILAAGPPPASDASASPRVAGSGLTGSELAAVGWSAIGQV